MANLNERELILNQIKHKKSNMNIKNDQDFSNLYQLIIYEPSTLKAGIQQTSYLPSNKDFKRHLHTWRMT